MTVVQALDSITDGVGVYGTHRDRVSYNPLTNSGCGVKNNPIRKLKFLENDKVYFVVFSPVNVNVNDLE